MTITCGCKSKMIKEAPAAVHIDNTVRPQTVEKKSNELYWRLIEKMGKLNGHYVVLNTSFNVRGEPIVCTPQEAVDCFLKTDIDYLCIGSYIASK